MTNTTNAIPIKIENSNNKLCCDFFTEINVAPKRPIIEHELEQIFLIKNEEEIIYAQVVDIVRTPFVNLRSTDTLPATGLMLLSWQKNWMEKHPETTADTEMAIYSYQRIKD